MIAASKLVVALMIAAAIPLAFAAAGPRPPRAAAEAIDGPLAGVGFLAGSWRGSVDGAFVEEIWSQPYGPSMMGVFRWCRGDGTPAMFELLAITREAGGESDTIRLRLRHYSSTLAAKEPADKPLSLVLKELTANSARFVAEKDAGDLATVHYQVEGDELRIEIAFTARGGADRAQEDGPREPLRFVLRRGAAAGARPAEPATSEAPRR